MSQPSVPTPSAVTVVPRTLVVGVGSPHGDDQAGWLVADRVAALVDPRQVVVQKATSPAQLLNWLDGVTRLVICDACQGLGDVGDVRRWHWPSPDLTASGCSPAVNWAGTHDLSLPATLELAARLGHLPPDVVVWGLETAHNDGAAPMSAAAERAVPGLAQRIAGELNDTPCHQVSDA